VGGGKDWPSSHQGPPKTRKEKRRGLNRNHTAGKDSLKERRAENGAAPKGEALPATKGKVDSAGRRARRRREWGKEHVKRPGGRKVRGTKTAKANSRKQRK